MNLLRKRTRNTPAASLVAAADRLRAAIDDYATEYGQHLPAGVSDDAARRMFADLAAITHDLDAVRSNGSVVSS